MNIGKRCVAAAWVFVPMIALAQSVEIAPQDRGYVIAQSGRTACIPGVNGNAYSGSAGGVCELYRCSATKAAWLNSCGGECSEGVPYPDISVAVVSATYALAQCQLYWNGTTYGSIASFSRSVSCPAGYSLSSDSTKCLLNGVVDDRNRGNSCNSGGTNPINLGIGNKFQSETDFEPVDGSRLGFVRYFNSLGVKSGLPTYQQAPAIGWNWTHSYSSNIFTNASASVTTATVVRPEGGAEYYTLRGNNQWVGDSDVQSRLSRILAADGMSTLEWRYQRCSDAVVEHYDAGGKLVQIEFPNDSLVLDYSDASTPPAIAPYPGLLVKVTDARSRSLSFTYDALGRVVELTGPGQSMYTYHYDGLGNLAFVTHPDDSIRDYLYEDSNNGASLTGILTEEVDRSSTTYRTSPSTTRYATYSYDAGGKTTLSTHAGSADRRTVVYNSDGTATVSDPGNVSRTFAFQNLFGLQHQSSLTSFCKDCGGGTTASSTFDPVVAQPSSKLDFNGNKSCFQYDVVNKWEVARIEGLAASSDCAAAFSTTIVAPTRKVSTQWHETWHLPRLTAAPLRITKQTFHGDVGVTCAPPGASTALICQRTDFATQDSTGGLGFAPLSNLGNLKAKTVSYTYNAQGRVLTKTGPRTDIQQLALYEYYESDDLSGNWHAGDLKSATDYAGHRTFFTKYDAAGRLLVSRDANGLETITTYDNLGRVLSTSVGTSAQGYATTLITRYPTGQVKSITNPDGYLRTFLYDGAHRLTDICEGACPPVGQPPVSLTHYALDGFGNATDKTTYDATGAIIFETKSDYFPQNLLKTEWHGNALSEVTSYTYDANGNQKTTTDPRQQTYVYDYDVLNRRYRQTDPQSGLSTYGYDGLDQLRFVTAPNSLITTYDINGLAEVGTLNSPDTGTIAKTYDSASNVLSTTDAAGRQTTYTYDVLDRVATISRSDEFVTYAYDNCVNGVGRLCRVTQKRGSVVYADAQYEYDVWGRVTKRTDQALGLATAVAYLYNLAGQLTQVTTPSGNVVTYAYEKNHVSSVKVNGSDVARSVVYDPLGPLAGWSWGNSTSAAPNAHLRYFDRDFRPSGFSSDKVGSSSASSTLTYTNGVISGVARGFGAFTYDYDAVGHLKTVSGPTSSQSFTYDLVGNRRSATIAGVSQTYTYQNNLLITAGPTSMGYDPAGNATSINANTFTYGGDARISSITTQLGSSKMYYNALGQRIFKGNPQESLLTISYMNSGTESGSLTPDVFSTGWIPTHFADFNGDGQLDLVMRNSVGAVAIWITSGRTITSRTVIRQDAAWSVSVAGDLDGNGKADLVWTRTDGAVEVWMMNGTSVSQVVSELGPNTGWKIVNSGDFDGDGKLDLLWLCQDGQIGIWLMDGATIRSAAGVLGPNTGWVPTLVGDFNGDGKADVILLYTTGQVGIWLMNGMTIVEGKSLLDGGTGWLPVGVADFNGDGKSDLLWEHSQTHQAGAWLMDGSTMLQAAGLFPNGDTRVLVAGDLDGDGKADLIWRDSQGAVGYSLMNGIAKTEEATLSHQYGGSSLAAVKDLDHDGRADLIWVNQPTPLSIRFAYDDQRQLIGEYDISGKSLREYVYLDGIVLAIIDKDDSGTNSTRYVHVDSVGAPRYVTNSTDNALRWKWETEGSPFGDAFPDEAPAGANAYRLNLRLPGQYFDAETGTNYNGYRDYDARTGRYVQSDPIGLSGGLNTFAYAGSSPLKNIDPLGLDVSWSGTVTGAGAVAGAGGQVMRFELTSECKCNRVVSVTGFASFISVGAGVKLPVVGDASAGHGHAHMTSIFDCPEAGDASGPASVFGINVITPIGGASYLTRLRLGRLSTGFHGVDGPLFGFDVSATLNMGYSAVLGAESKPCCSGN